MTQQTKAKYCIRNWSEYNKALVQRGSITIWFSPEASEKWLAGKTGRKGRPQTYSNEAIQCALMLKAVYHLPLRALRGLLLSLVGLLGLQLPIPCYTRICRRAGELGQKIQSLSHRQPKDLVFDSTGLKVYGEGEWKVRQHGASKRRTWRKLHLAICPDSHDIILECLSDNGMTDCQALPVMEKHIPRTVKKAYGDGAYDKDMCYQVFSRRGITPVVPPQRNAVFRKRDDRPWMQPRHDALFLIRGLGDDDAARNLWKNLSGYHKRSLVETTMYRFKTLFGGTLASRTMQNQKAEVFVKCQVINRMNNLGMPKGRWIKV